MSVESSASNLTHIVKKETIIHPTLITPGPPFDSPYANCVVIPVMTDITLKLTPKFSRVENPRLSSVESQNSLLVVERFRFRFDFFSPASLPLLDRFSTALRIP